MQVGIRVQILCHIFTDVSGSGQFASANVGFALKYSKLGGRERILQSELFSQKVNVISLGDRGLPFSPPLLKRGWVFVYKETVILCGCDLVTSVAAQRRSNCLVRSREH